MLSLIPLVSLIAWWHYASELSDFTDEKYHVILTFLLWIFLSPIVWFLAQMELDKAVRPDTAETAFGGTQPDRS